MGLIAGWLTGLVMKGGGYGIVGDLIVGLIGALIGGFIVGIFIHGSQAISNGVTNNLIGTQADGVGPLGNGGPGVLLDGDASNNSIGGRGDHERGRKPASLQEFQLRPVGRGLPKWARSSNLPPSRNQSGPHGLSFS